MTSQLEAGDSKKVAEAPASTGQPARWSFQQLTEHVQKADAATDVWYLLMPEAVPSPAPSPAEAAQLRFGLYQRLAKHDTSSPSAPAAANAKSSWASRLGPTVPSKPAPPPALRFNVSSPDLFAPYTLCDEHLLQTLLDRKDRCMPGVHAIVPAKAAARLHVQLTQVCDKTRDTALWLFAEQLASERLGLPLPVRIVSPLVATGPQFADHRRLHASTAMTLVGLPPLPRIYFLC